MTDDLRITGIDHIVLNVADAEKSLVFYCDVLCLEPLRVEEWRRKQVRFPSARVNEGMIIDLSEDDRTGENLKHFCLVIEPTDFEALATSGRYDVHRGPGVGFGARGDGHSMFIRDPDGNVVELRYYD